MTETWKPIPGYEGAYEVSNLGHVRGVARVLANGQPWPGRVLKGSVTVDGYRVVSLSHNARHRARLVHRLVLAAFVGPPLDGTVVCHNNGDPADNRLENLRYDTESANQRDSVLHGTHRHAGKPRCKNGHLYDEANTYRPPNDPTRRCCRACNRACVAAYAAARREEDA